MSLNKSGTLSGTRVLSGTSMAAPHVTGAAARYIAAVFNATAVRPTPDQVRSALRATAGFDWNASSDPTARPAHPLLNVAALSGTPPVSLPPSRHASWCPPPHASDPVVRVVDVELVRLGLFAKAVHISASGPTGITAEPAAQNLTGISDAGIATTVQLTVAGSVKDGDYPVLITASVAGSPSLSHHATITVHVDRHEPNVNDLAATMIPDTTLGGSVTAHLSWHGQDAGGTIVRYELQRQIGTEPWQALSLPSPTSSSADRLMELKTDYGFRVRATDDSGNIGDWTTISRRVGIRKSNRPSITYSGSGWTTVVRSSASGGSLASSRTAGAFAGVTFYGTGVAWVAPVGPGKGTATVIVDGHGPGVTVDLHAPALGTKRLILRIGRHGSRHAHLHRHGEERHGRSGRNPDPGLNQPLPQPPRRRSAAERRLPLAAEQPEAGLRLQDVPDGVKEAVAGERAGRQRFEQRVSRSDLPRLVADDQQHVDPRVDRHDRGLLRGVVVRDRLHRADVVGHHQPIEPQLISQDARDHRLRERRRRAARIDPGECDVRDHDRGDVDVGLERPLERNELHSFESLQPEPQDRQPLV